MGGGDEKTQMVWPSSVVYLTEEQVCMLTVRGAKKIAKKPHTPAKGKGEIEKDVHMPHTIKRQTH